MAFADLSQLPVFQQRRVRDALARELAVNPTAHSRRRKPLAPGEAIPWEHQPPVWELRIGDYRAFYDVDASARCVAVRAIRHKGRKQTKEIL
jgi:mRNA-degrading endonuclease RelE of RelBE toxin-antitoxin system